MFAALHERVGKFGLTLHEDKTRLIEFGRFAAHNRKAQGMPRPETFAFLGFTHYCGETRATSLRSSDERTRNAWLASSVRFDLN